MVPLYIRTRCDLHLLWKVLSSTTCVNINEDIDLNCSSFYFSGISMGIKVFSTKVYKRKRFKGSF